MSKLNWFKADTPDERSQDILVSFSSRWNDLLRNGSINFVFRRRYPKTLGAKRMFVYVGSPYSEIIGYSIIIDIKPMTFIEGIRLLDKARITKPELEKYFHGYSSVGGYRVSKITLFDSPVSLQTLRGESGFSPHRALFFYQSAHRSGSTSNLMPAKGRIAVKVINHLGDEVMKVFRVG